LVEWNLVDRKNLRCKQKNETKELWDKGKHDCHIAKSDMFNNTGTKVDTSILWLFFKWIIHCN
jgi:hypothetical protein